MNPGLWNDDPITGKHQDMFDRTRYAERAADLIAASHSWDTSIVFGLTGAWGSGKSSLVAMILESLQERHPEWAIARFTPWATNDVQGLLGEFYASLSDALPPRRGKAVRRAIGTLAQVSAPAATLIPYVGGSGAEAIKAAGAWVAASPSWEKAFLATAGKLKELSIPVVIVADDIDRLQTEELLALLKVVRLLGRFPGVQYLLAYDDRTLYRLLEVAGRGGVQYSAAERFMEKIVQYPLVVPPLSRHQLIDRLNRGLTQALLDAQRVDVESARLVAVADVFERHLSTPRALDRFLAQLRHHLPMVDLDEIDDVDVILLNLLRVAYPSVFNALPRWRATLLSGHTGEIKSTSRGIEFEPVDWTPLVAEVPEVNRADAVSLLKILFPKLRAKGGLSYTSSEGGRRICDEDYFDRYFAMGIPSHDVSDKAVEAAVVQAIQGDAAALRALLLDPDRRKAYLALTKGVQHSDKCLSDSDRLTLLGTLAACVGDLSDEPAAIFSAEQRVIMWMVDLLGNLGAAAGVDDVDHAFSAAEPIVELRAWHYARERIGEDPSRPAWAEALARRLSTRAIDLFINNLRSGDDAPEDDPAGYYLHFAIEQGDAVQLRERIAEAVESGAASRADLAARMVSVHTHMGPGATRRLGDFDQETWSSLAPSGDHAWYDLGVDPAADDRVLTWSNRRHYAQGRAKKPEVNHRQAT